MKDGQRPGGGVPTMDGHCVEVHFGLADAEELAPTISLKHGFIEGGQVRIQTRGEVGGHENGMALGVEDGDAFHALAIAEAVEQALQIAMGAFGQKWLHGLLETFGHELGAFFQIVTAGAAVRLDLVESEEDGDDGNGEDEGKDQAEAEAHSCDAPFGHTKIPLRKVN